MLRYATLYYTIDLLYYRLDYTILYYTILYYTRYPDFRRWFDMASALVE